MARVKTSDLSVERTASCMESDSVVGGAARVRGGSPRSRGGHPRGHSHQMHPSYSWHNTSHFHFQRPFLIRHWNHFHYVPGRVILHQTGHWNYQRH